MRRHAVYVDPENVLGSVRRTRGEDGRAHVRGSAEGELANGHALRSGLLSLAAATIAGSRPAGSRPSRPREKHSGAKVRALNRDYYDIKRVANWARQANTNHERFVGPERLAASEWDREAHRRRCGNGSRQLKQVPQWSLSHAN
jgi:hypothetical protein